MLLFYALVSCPPGMWDLGPLTRDQIRSPSIGRQSLNHRTNTQVPLDVVKISFLHSLQSPLFKQIKAGTCFEWGEGIEGSGRRPQPCSPDPPWRPTGSRWLLRSSAVLHSLAWRFTSSTWSISSVSGQLLPWARCAQLRGQHSPGRHSSRPAVYDSTGYPGSNARERLATILLWVPRPGLSASLGSPLTLVSPCQWSPALRAAGPDTSQPVSFLSF